MKTLKQLLALIFAAPLWLLVRFVGEFLLPVSHPMHGQSHFSLDEWSQERPDVIILYDIGFWFWLLNVILFFTIVK